MTLFQKKILFTFIPYILGYAAAYAVIAFIMWNKDPSMWTSGDRIFAIVLGWAIGSMLYMRFEHDRVR